MQKNHEKHIAFIGKFLLEDAKHKLLDEAGRNTVKLETRSMC